MNLQEIRYLISLIDKAAEKSYEELMNITSKDFKDYDTYLLKKEKLQGEQWGYNNTLTILSELENKILISGNKTFDISKVSLLQIGDTLVFDKYGKQIQELQEKYSIEWHIRILFESTTGTIFEGFEMLPEGFNKRAENFSNQFKNKNLYANWSQVQEVILEDTLYSPNKLE